MDIKRMRYLYTIASAIVWAGILIASAIILGDTPYFGQMLPILGGGAAFFVVVLPSGISTVKSGSSR